MTRKKKDKKNRKKPSRPGIKPPALPAGFGPAKVITTPHGMAKVSDVLMEFVEPYSAFWETEDQLRKLLSVALVAWNATVCDGEKAAALIRDTAQTLPADAQADFLGIVAEMIERKVTHFADIKRMILGYELTMTPGGPHLSVISSLDLPG